MIEATGSYADVLFYVGVGAAAAAIYLILLWLTVTALVRRRAMTPLVLGLLARLSFLASLVLAAYWVRIGPVELLSGLAGFLIVRTLALRTVPATVKTTRPGS